MPEIATRHISAPVWLVTIIGTILAGIILWTLGGIASDAKQGHSLAQQIKYDQTIFAKSLAEVKSDVNEQKQQSSQLSTRILLLNESNKNMNETLARQNKILEAIGDLTYRIRTLENVKHPDPWVLEQLKNYGEEFQEVRKEIDRLGQSVREPRKEQHYGPIP